LFAQRRDGQANAGLQQRPVGKQWRHQRRVFFIIATQDAFAVKIQGKTNIAQFGNGYGFVFLKSAANPLRPPQA
jgi:hypothetical protein